MKLLKEYAALLKPEDLPEHARLIAEISGVLNALEYCLSFGGVSVYLRAWNDNPTTWS